jgi:penicillin amidase
MGFILKWLLRLCAALLAVVAIGTAGVYYLAARSLPEYDATVTVQGLTAQTQIIRDNANVPHIIGQTDRDVMFGLGFAHAQDRLWQMSMMRRTAQGRLSEVFGSATLEIDTLMRRFDVYGRSVSSLSALSQDTQNLLQSYAAGVNARIDQINAQALGRGAPEMFLFTNPLSPWRPADSIAVLKLTGLASLQALLNEVERARASSALGDANRLNDLYPDIAARFQTLFPDAPRFAQSQTRPQHPLSPFRGVPYANGNGWAAGHSRSASGGTLLANDPNTVFSAPGLWYLARLNLQSGSVIGGSIPGIPAILAGRSATLGWARTAGGTDDLDIYIEQLNPQNPAQYLAPGGYRPFKTEKSIIEVKGAQPVTLTLRWTDNGPVIRSDFGLETILPTGTVAAISWTLLDGQDTSIQSAIDLMQAQTAKDAMTAAQTHVAPVQSLTLVDREHIALDIIGRRPIRSDAHQTQGHLPSPGWNAQNAWRGWMPPAAGLIDPDPGIVSNASLTGENDIGPQQRWTRLMNSRQVHTRDSFVEAQLDTVSFTARALLPLIGADLWFTEEAAPAGSLARQRQRALALLANWSGDMNEHMPEPLIYAAWMQALQKRMIEDDLGPAAASMTHLRPRLIERAFRGEDGAEKWCDVRHSARIETCSDLAIMALDDALIWIDENWGGQLESLRWGDAHQARHDHPVLGNVTALRYFMNIRQSTSGGDNTLMRGQSKGFAPNPFESTQGPGYRGVYDFADPDSSVFVSATGQSGHFLSRHYDDLAQLWRRGEYIPMSLDLGLARAASVGITTLVPGGN